MAKNAAKAATKYIIVEVVLDIVYFPVWWYTKGLAKLARFCFESVERMAGNLSLGIWMKNMFTPMFGQYDWQGRLISFMMRTVMLVYKFIVFIIWLAIILILFVGWVAAPLVVVYYIFYQWFHIPFPSFVTR